MFIEKDTLPERVQSGITFAIFLTVIAFALFGTFMFAMASSGTITIIPGQSAVVTCATTPVTSPVTPPVVTPPPTTPPTTTGETRFQVYNTLFGYPDNTPPNSDILSNGGHAKGTGTFTDPITMASGYILKNGQPIMDYPMGTKFYIPNERKYFIVADECGDLPNPESKPCHKSEQPPYPQLDLWAGGVGANKSSVIACEDAHTRVNLVIRNPASNYQVVPGSIYNSTCSGQYGDGIVTQ